MKVPSFLRGPRREQVIWALLATLLAWSLVHLPRHLRPQLKPAIEAAARWHDPASQLEILDPSPHRLLWQAAGHLPENARVLLITAGKDPKQSEYRTFHRALYALAPRPLYWRSPAPADGTWESRSWRSGPIDSESVLADAATLEISHILTLDPVSRLRLGPQNVDLAAGQLVALGDARFRTFRNTAPGPPARWWPLALIAALGVPLLLGAAVLSLLAAPCGGGERWALAMLIGTGLLTWAMFGLGLAGLGLDLQVALLTSLTLALAVLGRWLRRPAAALGSPLFATPPRPGVAASGLRFGLWVVIGSYFLLSILLAVGRPLSTWDSWVTWGMKARILFLDGGIGETILGDPSRTATHLDYPLQLPLAEAWLYSWLGQPDERLVGSWSVLYLAALLALLFSAVTSHGGSRRLALMTTAVVAATAHVWTLAGMVFADLPLAALMLGTAHQLSRFVGRGERAALVLTALCGGLLPWMKREGLVLVACLALAALWSYGRSRRTWTAVAALASGCVVLSGPWWLTVKLAGATTSDFASSSFAAMPLEQAVKIFCQTARSLSSPWASAVWWLLPPLLLWRIWRRQQPLAATPHSLLPATALLYLAAMSASYLWSRYTPIEAHIGHSFWRLAVHILPLVVLWIALLANTSKIALSDRGKAA